MYAQFIYIKKRNVKVSVQSVGNKLQYMTLERMPALMQTYLSETFGIGRSSVIEFISKKGFYRDKYVKHSGLKPQKLSKSNIRI